MKEFILNTFFRSINNNQIDKVASENEELSGYFNSVLRAFKCFFTSIVSFIHNFPSYHFLTIGALGICLLFVSTITPSSEVLEHKRLVQNLKLDLTNSLNTEPLEQQIANGDFKKAAAEPLATLSDSEASVTNETESITENSNENENEIVREHSEIVRNGDSLSLIFSRAGLSDTNLLELMNSLTNKTNIKQLKHLYPGEKFAFEISNQKLTKLAYHKSPLEKISFTRVDGYFVEEVTSLKADIHLAYREATIINSLFLAGTDAGLDENIVMELANIFSFDIDFALDIRTNDHFKVLYEEKFINGEKLANGPILAAEFTNQGKTYSAVRYLDRNGNSNYFTPEGQSVRKAFLRSPVSFSRISSHFNLARMHPVLNRIRAHKGTDYAAPTGTPVMASGDGKVIHAGNHGGYGKTVVIKHGQTYKTLYAHLSRYGKGVHSGKRVKQGDIIGYVGSSGLATGPHLHYEFYVNNRVQNPVRVALPKAGSIPESEIDEFKEQTRSIVAQLKAYGKRTEVAALEVDADSN